MLGLENPNRKILFLSSTTKCESTRADRDVILEDAEKKTKGQRYQLHPENFNCILEKKLAILVVKHYNGQRGKGSPALNKALSREVGLSNLSKLFFVIKYKTLL